MPLFVPNPFFFTRGILSNKLNPKNKIHMKQLLQKKLAFLLSALVFLVACSKDVVQKPGPVDPGKPAATGSFRFTMTALPGESEVLNGLSVVVDMMDGQQRPVWTAKKLALTHEGSYRTEMVNMKEGAYRVTGFKVVDAQGRVLFVTPVEGSARASKVNRPLPLLFEVVKNASTAHPMELAKVVRGDRAEDFGYAAGSFSGGPLEPYRSIIVHPVIKVGELVYDQVPVPYTLRTWDANNNMTQVSGILPAGPNELTLDGTALKYEIRVSKFGATDAITLNREEIEPGTIYTLGGAVDAKKLKTEMVFRMGKNESQFKAYSRNDFVYDPSGRVIEIGYLRKDANFNTYLHNRDHFTYGSGWKTTGIRRTDKDNGLEKETSFTYDNNGRVTRMTEKKGADQTFVSVRYIASPDPGLSGNYTAEMQFDFSNNVVNLFYNKNYEGGKMVSDASSRGTAVESGTYEYDTNINPYAHLNWPDLWLTHSSKHNMTESYKVYNGAYPEMIAYDYEYTYDNEGYPTSLVRSFKSFANGSFLFKEKTVFVY